MRYGRAAARASMMPLQYVMMAADTLMSGALMLRG